MWCRFPGEAMLPQAILMSTSLSLNLRATLGAIAQHVLSRRQKRLILFSTLTAVLKQDDELDKQTLEKLNLVMRLSSDVEAMKFPVKYIRSAVWKGGAPIRIPDFVFAKQASEQDVQTALSELVTKIPRWLRYKDAEMKSDAERFLLNGREYLDRRRNRTASQVHA